MVALDTNVIVRFLVNDDVKQARKARTLIEGGKVFIAPTVLLETEWVLRSAYGFAAKEILVFFRALLGLPNVTVGAAIQLAATLKAYEQGLDFADALHLVFSGEAETFATFDRQLIQRAQRVEGAVKVIHA